MFPPVYDKCQASYKYAIFFLFTLCKFPILKFVVCVVLSINVINWFWCNRTSIEHLKMCSN